MTWGKPAIPPDDFRHPYPYTSKPFLALLNWAKVKNVELQVPEKNIWDMPFPPSRLPRAAQLHHMRLRNQCPAPLPIEEYKKLVRYAKGEETPPQPKWKRYLPLSKERLKEIKVNNERPHDMSARSWRRLYTKLANKSCALRVLPGGKWEVVSEPIEPRPEDGTGEEFEINPAELNAHLRREIRKRGPARENIKLYH